MAGAVKRRKPEHDTPSPTNVRQGKKPRTNEQGSYSQATRGLVKLAVVADGFPETRLGPGEVEIIRKMIRGRILGLPQGTKAPTFTGFWERDGAIVVACANEETGGWLKSLTLELEIGGKPLRVLPLEALPKRHRVVVHVEEPDVTVEEAIKLLDRQNEGLEASGWIVARGSGSRDASSAHFACLIGDSSLEALKKTGLRPFCGLGRATVRLLARDKDRGGKPGTEPTATPKIGDEGEQSD